MRNVIVLSAVALFVVLSAASAQDPPKQKPSVEDDAKALQGTWDRPPTKGADGKLIHGFRVEVRDQRLTAWIYAKAGDPKGGDHLEIGRPFALKEASGKRIIHEEGTDIPLFTYQLEGKQLTLISEDSIVKKTGKDWNVPIKNVLTKVPDKK